MSYRKSGGLHFVRIWRFGASFYVTRRAAWVIAGNLRP
jgi:hypothetical protein